MADSVIQPVTEPPAHHFFGYYEKSPWDRSERYLLTHEVDFDDRIPRLDDEAKICLLDVDDGYEKEVVGTTAAWNFQQGSMLQWLGPDYGRRIMYNDVEDGEFVARIHDIHGDEWTIPHPIYAPTPDGRTGFTLDFARLYHTRQGYGYAPADATEPEDAPPDDGVYRVDLRTGDRELLVSLADLVAFEPLEHMNDVKHWVNHLQVSPSGDRVAFLHRWWTDATRTWHTRRGRIDTDRTWHDRLFVMNADGSDLTCLVSGAAGHYDWRTDATILADTLPEPGGERRFRWYDVETETVEPALPTGIRGHTSFSPDRRWILYDRPVPGDNEQHLVLRKESVDAAADDYVDLASVPIPSVTNEDLRCDLHPRWDRSGRRICFDSLHTGKRQLYVVDVSDWTIPTYE